MRRRIAPGWVALLLLAACGNEASGTVGVAPDELATRFAVVGDFGTGNEEEIAIANAIRAAHDRENLAAIVTTGDNIYPAGEPEDFDEAWNVPYGWAEDAGLDVVASLGNHDVKKDHEGEGMALLGMPHNWYQTQVGRVQMIVLDANDVENPAQLAFLERSLEAPRPDDAGWRVLVFHHPAYSCAKHGSTREVMESWVPLIAAADVDLVLNGHDHAYQRFGPVDGTTYIVTGGGGAALYDIGECEEGTPEPEVAVSTFHFVEVEATAEEMRLSAVLADGEVIDGLVLTPDGT